MIAFYKDGDFLAKVYDQGSDMQVLSSGTSVEHPETWTSSGYCIGVNTFDAIKRALKSNLQWNGREWNKDCLVVC